MLKFVAPGPCPSGLRCSGVGLNGWNAFAGDTNGGKLNTELPGPVGVAGRGPGDVAGTDQEK